MHPALQRFSSATREWFAGAFGDPTPVQAEAWRAISGGGNALVVAPTGSGKTLSAFLWAIDRLMSQPGRGTRVLYISPLKALGVDVERNLQQPLRGIVRGMDDAPSVSVGVRSGDTPATARQSLLRNPPDILITTPESLYLMLTSRARETLATVETVIIDEIHAVAATKRGAHLAVSLERLDDLLPQPAQRIGLSATVRPLEEVARFLGGAAPAEIVAPPAAKTFDLQVSVPVEDMAEAVATAGSIWPHVDRAVLDAILAHKSTIVFTNSRRLAERLTARLNEEYAERLGLELPQATIPAVVIGQSGSTRGLPSPRPAEPSAETAAGARARTPETASAFSAIARAHHGSVSKEVRAEIEAQLKSGELRCVVATSSLELGIDMGAVDLVVQVGAPPSVASGLQRVGRAGHKVGDVSQGVVFPSHRADLLHSAVTVERMRAGQIEALAIPQNPLDVLAQQTVAAVALDPVNVDDWYATVRRSAPFSSLPRSAFEAVLDLLAGRYPSDEFAELRPRIVWDRVAGTIAGRPGAQRLAVTSGGTIPDRGLFGVFIVGSEESKAPRRVGELDEEMVYETRVGDVIALGATSWKVEDITPDRVLVSPAFGQPGRVPFWKGDAFGRPAELGQAIGQFAREVADNAERLRDVGLDEYANRNLVTYLAEQRAATGIIPNDREFVVERFPDELGDWRVVLHSPYGSPVHAPWALAVTARIRERYGVDAAALAGDDGIVVRIPASDAAAPGAELFQFDPDELERLVIDEAGSSALFASRFRENAGRALLLPHRDPGRRSPLWQQRLRSAQLLDVARGYPEFPIVLETVREVLQDVYDLPALLDVATRIRDRRIRIAEVETRGASPFAQSLLFGYVMAFMYQEDVPAAERRAAALSLDPALLGELLGRAELQELVPPPEIERLEAELQRLVDDRKARDEEGVADLLRMLGPLSTNEVRDRSAFQPEPALAELEAAGRVIRAQVAGEERWAAGEDAARLRDALGTRLPDALPAAFLVPVPDPLVDLVSRQLRTHGPQTVPQLAARFGLGVSPVSDAVQRLVGAQRAVAFGDDSWVDAEVLRRLRARSLAAARAEVEPVAHDAYARFLLEWQHVGGALHGADGLLEVVAQLAGVPLPASALESLVLPARIRDYQPAMLDELTTSGDVLWSGCGEGRIALHLADSAPFTLAPLAADAVRTESERRILDVLAPGGAFFFRQLAAAIPEVAERDLSDALWALAWSGAVGNDSLAAVRAKLVGPARKSSAPPQSKSAARTRARVAAAYSAGTVPVVAGRWSILPRPEVTPTARAAVLAELLLERHGVVTRGAVVDEEAEGGFAAVYRVLAAMEDAGRVRRGYFVAGLGAAQFAAAGAVDRLRALELGAVPVGSRSSPSDAISGLRRDAGPDRRPGGRLRATHAVALAAEDPANPYGAALPWPASTDDGTHRPGRKDGALVVLVDGVLALYVERGGKTMLTFASDPGVLSAAAECLATTARSAGIRMRVETIDGTFSVGTPVGDALLAAGFAPTPQGLRLR